MPTREPPRESDWADEAATERSESPFLEQHARERTSKERCQRCGRRASTRCAGCGEAFCTACVDPISSTATAVSCRTCVLPPEGGPAWSRPLLERVLTQCLRRLAAATTNPLVRAMRDEALACQAEIDSWRPEPPPLEVRGAMRERLLALNAKVEAYAAEMGS